MSYDIKFNIYFNEEGKKILLKDSDTVITDREAFFAATLKSLISWNITLVMSSKTFAPDSNASRTNR